MKFLKFYAFEWEKITIKQPGSFQSVSNIQLAYIFHMVYLSIANYIM